jgi:peptidoglycan/xylan/chitin deacetylase (PgdA/CDA1 family)
MYHAIGDGPNDLYLQTELFEQQIGYLSKNKYNFIDFEDLQKGVIPNKPIILTFDDGYKNLYDNAYPILKKYNAKATIFLISNFIGATGYLSTEEISQINDLVSFQSHTVSHPDLRYESIESVNHQARASKETIQGLVKNKVIAFCYPSGKFNEEVIKITKKYYNYGITIIPGIYSIKDDHYIISRIRINKDDTANSLRKKLSYKY